MAIRLCTEFVDPASLEAWLANRLIPLDKCPGVRPIGIGESPRRIVGKAVLSVLKPDIQAAAGNLQVAAGQEAGVEAAIHAMRRLHENEACDGIVLIDAKNAFNELNRATALWNTQIVCPPFSTVLINTYRGHARLFVAGGGELLSREGTTQGCPLAMPMYSVGVLPLISGSSGHCHQVWYADDATGSGRLPSL